MSFATRKSDTHEERYVHFVMVNSPRVYRATLFARRAEEHEPWRATVSFCAIGDQFSRRVGRAVARRRFFQRPQDRYAIPEFQHQAALMTVQRAYWQLFGSDGIVLPLPL